MKSKRQLCFDRATKALRDYLKSDSFFWGAGEKGRLKIEMVIDLPEGTGKIHFVSLSPCVRRRRK